MSTLEENLSDVSRHIDYDDAADIPSDVYHLLSALVEEVKALKETAPSAAVAETGGMSRVDALKAAREHVEAMSTNGRGYQDGVKLSDKVQAVDRFARFLMGESE
ncbi:hypothetical protein [Streptomyces sp. NBC_00076]|uniref:hypothetical protein n=1 Tax=Streptomyces sp. NBC_00076 TaxID=2975642 RepID=UPI0032562181